VKLWSADGPEPISAYQDPIEFPLSYETTLVVPVCAECERGGFELKLSESAAVTGEVVGYFRPLTAADSPGGGIAFLGQAEGWSNNFYGYGAGASNSGYGNSFFGGSAGVKNTTGGDNSFFGDETGFYNTTGIYNSFFGAAAGHENTVGDENSFFGMSAGYENTTGDYNSCFGAYAGYLNEDGIDNSFFGAYAGFASEGDRNSFFGVDAGGRNTGNKNSFFGAGAGSNNRESNRNSFFGEEAGYENREGYGNSFFGRRAGYENTNGFYNSFFGLSAGLSNTVEEKNTFVGVFADLDPGSDPATSPVINATAVGFRSYVSQSDSLVLGSIAGVNDAVRDVNVGIGTTAPETPLHVKRTDGTAKVYVEEASATSGMRKLFELKNKGIPYFSINNTNAAEWLFMSDGVGNFSISKVDSGVTEFSLDKMHLTIAGTLIENSDRDTKTDIETVDPQEVLQKVAIMPISEWSRKEDKDRARHIGPMAQDFYSAFRLGPDERKIATIDTSGVALAAIQGLYQVVREKDARIERLESELAEIKEMLTAR
jgi:hypothetical protein